MAKTPLIALRLNPQIRRELEEVCKKNSLSLSDAVRLAIRDFVDRMKNDKSRLN